MSRQMRVRRGGIKSKRAETSGRMCCRGDADEMIADEKVEEERKGCGRRWRTYGAVASADATHTRTHKREHTPCKPPQLVRTTAPPVQPPTQMCVSNAS